MRPLVPLLFVALLAGCSLPYEGTSFKADPKLESALRGDGKEEKGEKEVATGMVMYGADADDKIPPREESPMDRTGIVFPPTAQRGD